MTNPRIFYLATSLNIGGTETFLAQLAGRLRGKYDISIGYIKEKGAVGAQLEEQGFRLHHLPGFRSLFLHLKKERYDMVQTFLYRAHIMGRVCGTLAGVPVIVSTQQAVDIWKNAWLSLGDRFTAPLCRLIITNSRAAEDSLARREKISRAKMRVVYNGINHERFVTAQSKEAVRAELCLPPDITVIACVMRLHYDKGVDFLPEIAASLPGVLFLIIGDGPERPALEQKIAGLRLAERFVLLGWRQDIARLLKSADIFLLPSREESFPQAVLEAMAMGLPVVATEVGGVRELVENEATGFVVQRGDIAGFVQALARLSGDRSLRASMGQASFERSKFFSEDRMVAEMDGLYSTLLRRGKCISS